MAIPAHLNQTPYPTYSAAYSRAFKEAGVTEAWATIEPQLVSIMQTTDWPEQDSWVPKHITVYNAHACGWQQAAKMLGYIDDSVPNVKGTQSRECGKVAGPVIQRRLADAGKLDTLSDGQPAMEVPMLPPNIPDEGEAERVKADITPKAAMDFRLLTRKGPVPVEMKLIGADKFHLSDDFSNLDRLSYLEEALLEHAHQLRLYQRLNRLPFGLVLLVCRETGDVKSYIVQGWLSDAAFERLVDIRRCVETVKAKRLSGLPAIWLDMPKPEPRRGYSGCQGCINNEDLANDTLPPPGVRLGCPIAPKQRGERKIAIQPTRIAVKGQLVLLEETDDEPAF